MPNVKGKNESWMTITIVGLGPGEPIHLTRQAWDVLSQADEVYLRTRRHPTIAGLPAHLALHSFDYVYETLDNFADVYDTIAAQIVDLGRRSEGVLYAVPGHPLVGESSVLHILAHARQERLAVRIVEGLSFVEPVLSLLGIDGLAGLQLADATDLAAAHHPPLDPDRPALIGQLYGLRLASEVKLTLMNGYPDDHPVTLVRAAGTSKGTMVTLLLYELDRDQYLDHLTTLYMPPLPRIGGLPAFQETIARLRAPDGCPWDREQTHQSLRDNLLEEAYEVLDALDAKDEDKLCEELGDLLMQIAMHAQIATEEGAFQFADVIGQIDAKLKRRHPHVFGDLEVEGTADVLHNWEKIKDRERATSVKEKAHPSRLDGVPGILPALARAQALGDRAARAGFDWPDLQGVLDKVGEEVTELRAATDPEARARELGDLLFSLVNVARWLEVDAESALRGTCQRFVHRYGEMEQEARTQGLDLASLPPSEQDALWERAKNGI
jgi:tetrapyrrole methylase family protein/MazG family protein